MQEERVRGSVVILIIGAALAAIGAFLGQSPESHDLGSGFVLIGEAGIALGLLIEFFSIGASLRRIARHFEPEASPGGNATAKETPGQASPDQGSQSGRAQASNPITRFWDGE